jgi:hypothetical protein
VTIDFLGDSERYVIRIADDGIGPASNATPAIVSTMGQ